MSEYYRAQKTRGMFDPSSDKPFRTSRAKVELFMNCPRCFYLEARCGTARPPSMPFNLNSAVDELLKREFDVHRTAGTPHPLMVRNGINAVPYNHPSMDEWRIALSGGIRYIHPATNLELTGAPDDIWINPASALHVVDYKATSKDTEVSLDAAWQIGYKRQVSFYGKLFEWNGFAVDSTAYFVYCNGRKKAESFDGKLQFDIKVIPYVIDTSWIEPTIIALKACLMSPDIPSASADCDWCNYRSAVSRHEQR